MRKFILIATAAILLAAVSPFLATAGHANSGVAEDKTLLDTWWSALPAALGLSGSE
jgi:hypothetical protein